MYTKNRAVSFLTGLFAAALILIGIMAPREACGQYTITVTAGGFDRMETVVSFTLPEPVTPGVYSMEDESGNQSLLQVDEQNKGWFLLESLSAGSSKSYSLDTESTEPVGGSGVTRAIDTNTITFNAGEHPVLSYYHGKNNPPGELDERYERGGYLHPVYSPGGTVLTNHLDTAMHPHHYGIWSAWTNTEFQGRTPDFWNIQQKTALVDQDSIEVAWEGPVHGGLKAKHYFVDLTSSAPVIAVNEEWEMKVYDAGNRTDYLMFDLTLTHTANTAQPLILPEYHYGGMGFRGHQNWDNPDNATFLTSRGHDRSAANETRARWAHMGGVVDGKRAGIAVLSHPDNYRAPQPVRIHPETPYFVFAPMQLGEMAIEPGSPYVMRYRYVTYDGEPDPEKLNRLWNDYAYPPGVTVEKE